MSDDSLAKLLAVQDLDTSITQLQHRRVALAEKAGLTALEATLAGLAAEQADAEGRRAELVRAQKDLEAQIATINERRTGIEQRMYAARGSSTRDLQAMDEEVRHLTQRRSELEEQELVAMVDQEPIDAELKVLAERRAPIEEKVAVLRAEVARWRDRDRRRAGHRHRGPGRRGRRAAGRAGRSLRGPADAPARCRGGPADRPPLRRLPPRAVLGRGRAHPRAAAGHGRHLRPVRPHPHPGLTAVSPSC